MARNLSFVSTIIDPIDANNCFTLSLSTPGILMDEEGASKVVGGDVPEGITATLVVASEAAEDVVEALRTLGKGAIGNGMDDDMARSLFCILDN